jgi:hypothetical protein
MDVVASTAFESGTEGAATAKANRITIRGLK